MYVHPKVPNYRSPPNSSPQYLAPYLTPGNLKFQNFVICYINGIIHYVTFLNWLSEKLSIILSNLIQVFIGINSSFLFIIEQYSILWVYDGLFNHSLEECLGGLQIWAIIYKTTMNIHIQIFFIYFY